MTIDIAVTFVKTIDIAVTFVMTIDIAVTLIVPNQEPWPLVPHVMGYATHPCLHHTTTHYSTTLYNTSVEALDVGCAVCRAGGWWGGWEDV